MKKILAITAVTVVLAGCTITKDEILNSEEFGQLKNTFGCAALIEGINRIEEYQAKGKEKFPALVEAGKQVLIKRFNSRCVTEE